MLFICMIILLGPTLVWANRKLTRTKFGDKYSGSATENSSIFQSLFRSKRKGNGGQIIEKNIKENIDGIFERTTGQISGKNSK